MCIVVMCRKGTILRLNLNHIPLAAFQKHASIVAVTRVIAFAAILFVSSTIVAGTPQGTTRSLTEVGASILDYSGTGIFINRRTESVAPLLVSPVAEDKAYEANTNAYRQMTVGAAESAVVDVTITLVQSGTFTSPGAMHEGGPDVRLDTTIDLDLPYGGGVKRFNRSFSQGATDTTVPVMESLAPIRFRTTVENAIQGDFFIGVNTLVDSTGSYVSNDVTTNAVVSYTVVTDHPIEDRAALANTRAFARTRDAYQALATTAETAALTADFTSLAKLYRRFTNGEDLTALDQLNIIAYAEKYSQGLSGLSPLPVFAGPLSGVADAENLVEYMVNNPFGTASSFGMNALASGFRSDAQAYNELANDPPRFDYDIVDDPDLLSLDGLYPEITAVHRDYMESAANQSLVSTALLKAQERFLGASIDGDTEAASIQSALASRLYNTLDELHRDVASDHNAFLVDARRDFAIDETDVASVLDIDPFRFRNMLEEVWFNGGFFADCFNNGNFCGAGDAIAFMPFGIIELQTRLTNTSIIEDVAAMQRLPEIGLYDEFARTEASLGGDYNGDGVTSVEDYLVWAADYGMGLESSADGNSDGVVDAADYVIWRDNVHPVVPAVPEPVSAVACCLALLLCANRQRHRHRLL